MMKNIKELEKNALSWATIRPDIRAVLVVGSRARRQHSADEWSDLDLMIFSTNFNSYLSDTAWLAAIGVVWVCLPHQTGDGDPELLVLFDGGYKVDFIFYTLEELGRLAKRITLPSVYHRGYYVLLDKDKLAAQIPPSPFTPPSVEPVTEADFQLAVNGFWYGAVYVAKQIRRRNLWVVKFRDWTMKTELLKMAAWHARTIHGWDYDTWHNGHFLSEWTDPQTWQALHNAFGNFEAGASWRALVTTMDLFRRLATEAGARLGYDYSETLDRQVTQFVNVLYQEDSRST